jgi:hypothetical protein
MSDVPLPLLENPRCPDCKHEGEKCVQYYFLMNALRKFKNEICICCCDNCEYEVHRTFDNIFGVVEKKDEGVLPKEMQESPKNELIGLDKTGRRVVSEEGSNPSSCNKNKKGVFK